MSDSRPAFAYGLHTEEESKETALPPGAIGAIRRLDRTTAYLWAAMEADAAAKGDAPAQSRPVALTITHGCMADTVSNGLFSLSTTKRGDGSLRFMEAKLDVPGNPELQLAIKVDPNFRNGRPGDWRMVLAAALRDDRNGKAWLAGGKVGAEKPVTMEAWAGPRVKVHLQKRE